MTGRPTVSVVLPTARRPRGLAAALAGLAGQEGAPPHEVVVVDNAPGDPAVAATLREHPGCRVVVEPRPGAAHARNAGVAAALADVVAFVDDDCVPDSGWLAALHAPLLAGDADLVGGRVLLAPDRPRPGWLAPGLEGYLTHLDLGPLPRPLGPGETLLTASLLARRADLLAHPFDPVLGPRPGSQVVADDVQVVRDLRAAGARAWWAPGAVVVHDLPEERLHPQWLLRRAFWQGRSDWRVDRPALQARRAHGARVAAGWWADELRRRAREPRTRATALHAACDLARTAGCLVEAASWRRPGPTPTGER